MALAKSVFVDKCEVVSLGSTTYTPTKWKILQVRTATVIKEDGVRWYTLDTTIIN